jgi:hypothetical protein
MERINVSLPPELRGQLEAASAKSGKTIADEIRTRVSVGLDADGPTLDLLAAIARMAAEVERETNSAWHSHPGAHDVLRQAIVSWMGQYKPEGDARFGPRPHQAELYDDPLKLGIQIAFNEWEQKGWEPAVRQQLRLAKERNVQELLKLQQQREQERKD